MTKPLEIAKLYFELSNKSDFVGIEGLLSDTTTYSSPATGIYLGSTDIMAMQRAFHSKFASLHWRVNSVKEVKSGIILFDFDFVGKLPNGDMVENTGSEYVIVYLGMIQHIEIRNRVVPKL